MGLDSSNNPGCAIPDGVKSASMTLPSYSGTLHARHGLTLCMLRNNVPAVLCRQWKLFHSGIAVQGAFTAKGDVRINVATCRQSDAPHVVSLRPALHTEQQPGHGIFVCDSFTKTAATDNLLFAGGASSGDMQDSPLSSRTVSQE